MNKLLGTIACAIILLMLLPATNISSPASPDNNIYPSGKTVEAETTRDNTPQSQSELCPALLELPLMLGRPAPCIRNFKITK